MQKKSNPPLAYPIGAVCCFYEGERLMRPTELNIEGKKSQAKSFAFRLLTFTVLCGLYGCSVVSPYVGLRREEPSYDQELLAAYQGVKLNKSITLDVLPVLKNSPHELLSQSDSVVAALGQSKNGYKTWFNMVAFDEYKLAAKRKYFFAVDEKVTRSPTNSRRPLLEPRQGLAFDCEMVLEKELLDKSYAAENARQIAILRQVSNNLRRDIDELGEDIETAGQDNKMLHVCGMLINQTFQTILLTLETSPVLATKLSDKSGVEFDHVSFDKGKIRMVVENDIVRVKIRLGVLTETFGQ